MTDRIHVLELLPRIVLTSLIAGFFKSNISKTFKDQVDFLFADKYQDFLQFGVIAFGGCGKVCLKYPK